MANYRIPSSQVLVRDCGSTEATAGDSPFEEKTAQAQDRSHLCVSIQDNRLAIDFASSFHHVDLAIEKILSFVKQLDTNLSLFEINVVVRDALNNAVEHGNMNDISKRVYCEVELEKSQLNILIRDEGDGFDWKNHHSASLSDMSERGRGLLLMNIYKFNLLYNEKGNILYLSKVIV